MPEGPEIRLAADKVARDVEHKVGAVHRLAEGREGRRVERVIAFAQGLRPAVEHLVKSFAVLVVADRVLQHRGGDAFGRRFGDPERPLLLSVRSGASASMPGMMSTILDLGMNKAILEGLAEEAGGRCSDFAGGGPNRSGAEVVASNGGIHEGMLAILGGA